MFRGIIQQIEKKRAQRFLSSIHDWYRSCKSVIKVINGAVNNPHIYQDDIGAILDQADRKLFSFRNEASDAHRSLRRYDASLAQRLDKASKKVFRLRNITARFLIRAQGPGPFAIKQPLDENQMSVYYYRALGEVGYDARALYEEVNREVDSLWRDLQAIIVQVKRNINQ